ncbi:MULTISPECIES: gliding motility-associated ABC transporter ATP-binding subunit GldA [Persicobacter]|uniref:Multidrug ABC transporter ATP-binding protein n=1 Tax=Persicobacter diffluens TaxID=981 RepID=A0AAN4VVP4_9BACT|nr:gliding motility-associated ABC transporter ATP-binding subunit GldA [Persicobacter sp. CCB-QB2]GJM60548.1 multidrug ABC transporter ATP-binding protein [Persicobacter diffluens]
MSVKINNLCKIYGEQKAVNQISFEAHPGEILGFLGPNGAGKSTTMKISTGYLSPSSGTVEICGIDVTENPLQARAKVGYLPENNPLYLDMYVHEYLRFAGKVQGLRGSFLAKRVSKVVEMCGLEREQNKKIGQLSKGYKQRVGLAQAFIHDPEVLILDEPTTGLDPNQLVEIRQLIKEVGKNKTVIFSSHIMQEVQALCDRVIIIDQGNIITDHPINDLKYKLEKQHILLEIQFEADLKPILDLEGVEAVEEIGALKYRIVATGQQDLRYFIFQAAAQNNIPLIELSREQWSIEKAFQELTS